MQWKLFMHSFFLCFAFQFKQRQQNVESIYYQLWWWVLVNYYIFLASHPEV